MCAREMGENFRERERAREISIKQKQLRAVEYSRGPTSTKLLHIFACLVSLSTVKSNLLKNSSSKFLFRNVSGHFWFERPDVRLLETKQDTCSGKKISLMTRLVVEVRTDVLT